MAKDKDKGTENMVQLRFRKSVTLADGTVCGANSLMSVEATAEVWALVNKGDADMEPGPGINGQPFPPKEITEVPPLTPEEVRAAEEAHRTKPKTTKTEEAAGGGAHAPHPHATHATHKSK